VKTPINSFKEKDYHATIKGFNYAKAIKKNNSAIDLIVT
jgi:hypothetical protein